MSITCKGCGSKEYVRNGYVHGVQRYRCKGCGLNFVEGDRRQKYTIRDRLKVLKLYLENCGIRTIERLTGINNRQVSLWLEGAANDIKKELERHKHNIKSVEDIEILEMDELCTYIKKHKEWRRIHFYMGCY